jgi:hypothetical protein
MITIACVLREGGKVGYNATWVKKLHNSISRNLTIPFKFVCLSDCAVPCERIPLYENGPGYWAKMQLFRPGLFDGPVLFFDLDTVICNNIDDLVQRLLDQHNFIMWRDDHYNISSSAIMYWNGDYSAIYNSYILKQPWYETHYSPDNQTTQRLIGDQAVISSLVDHEFVNNFCPESWIHVVGKHDDTCDLSETRILIFRKLHTKPSTLPNHQLVKEHWV